MKVKDGVSKKQQLRAELTQQRVNTRHIQIEERFHIAF